MRARLVKESLGDILKPKSQEDIIKELRNLSQEEKNKKLIDASWNGQVDLVKLLIEDGIDINFQNEYGNTALMTATYNYKLKLIKYLIAAGANVNAKNEYGITALMLAYKKSYKDIVNLLKKYGAKE